MTVLVTGGAGYIGSHMTYALLDCGEKVVVLDNLSSGTRGLVGQGAVFVEGDAGDQALTQRLFREHAVEAVIHFAGSIVVPELVEHPLAYYANNVVVSRALIEACVRENVTSFIFSSTATVYASDAKQPLAETESTVPISPYARSKLMTEWILEDTSRAHDGFRHAVLRYFNVAGADALGRTGQSTPKATHLIKRACQVALGRVPHLDIFGTDYPTPDGTGIRDYIHVSRSRCRASTSAGCAARRCAIGHLQCRLRPRPQRAGSGAWGGAGDGARAAGEGKRAACRRSTGAHLRSVAHQDSAELAAAA